VIAVISGRPLDDLADRIRLPIILAGDNGLRIEGPGLAFEHAGAKALRPMLAEACQQLHQTVAKWEGAFVEDKSLTGIVHYPKVDGQQHRGLVHEVRHCLAKYGSHLGVRIGQGAIEIHPRVEWDKGSCLAWIKQEKGLEMNPCICIGSDPADESMFAANNGQLNIKVGLAGRSAASLRLSDVSEVAAVLAHIEQVIQPGAARLA
jgi:trehalose-phosphatase